LMMKVIVKVDNTEVEATALVDTGAQTSLVRRGLFPEGCFRRSEKPLALKTVTGEDLPGGREEVRLKLTFAQTDDKNPKEREWTTEVVAHDGVISCDLILGYPWLSENRLDVQPWRATLQLHDPPRWILTEGGPGRPPEAEDSDDEDLVAQVRKMRLREEDFKGGRIKDEATEEDPEGEPGKEEATEEDSEGELGEEEAMEVAAQLAAVRRSRVCGVVQSEDADESPLAQELRAEIMEEFAGRVFGDRVHPNPPARGTHGKAVLRLKTGATPVVGRVINLKGERLEALKEMEEECLRDEKVEPGRGPWRAAAFPVKKKSGKWRLVCDYSKTNQMIQTDSYPLPLTEEIVCEQARCEIFSTIDLKDAFHQVALDEQSRQITNIHLPGGLWQWKVVPQGINVGPALLQRDIDATCQPLREFARAYFDDILVATRRKEGESDNELLQRHAEDVRRTLAALERDRWVSDPKKVRLFMKRVEFVGHVLGGGRRTPAPGKLAAVQQWRLPPNVSSLRAFLGLCNYYSGYVRMYAEMAAPLLEKLKLPRELTKAGSQHPIVWTEDEKVAFERLKTSLVAELSLLHVDPSRPFAIRTDASNYAIGAALEQFPGVDGMPTLDDLRAGGSIPVGFMSRKLTEGQRLRWDTRDKETYTPW